MNKVALVTGGAKRVGKAICLELARKGYDVIVHYGTSQEDAMATREACLRSGARRAFIIPCDLADKAARNDLIPNAVHMAGPIDLLVNSASMFEYDEAKTYTPQALDQHIQTNFLAPVDLTMGLYFATRANETIQQAHVVSLLDQKLFNLNTDYMTYTQAKLANHASIRYLAQCCAPCLRVNAVAPGLTDVSGSMSAQDFAQAHTIAALGRSSTAHDIAQAILMLDSATAITGQTIVVDGGQHLVPRSRDVAFGD